MIGVAYILADAEPHKRTHSPYVETSQNSKLDLSCFRREDYRLENLENLRASGLGGLE